MSAVYANVKIAGYQATLGSIQVLTLPLTWLFFKVGLPPFSVGFAFISTMIMISIGRVFWGQYLLNMTMREWIIKVLFPCLIVAFISAILVFSVLFLLLPSFSRFILIWILSCTTTSVAAWFFVCNAGEKEFIIKNIKAVWLRIVC